MRCRNVQDQFHSTPLGYTFGLDCTDESLTLARYWREFHHECDARVVALSACESGVMRFTASVLPEYTVTRVGDGWVLDCKQEISSGCAGRGLDPFHHLGRGCEACLLKHDAAVLEDHKVWNALDVITRRNVGMPLGIDFEHQGATCHQFGDPFHFGSRCSTRPTPRGPKIYQNG